MYFGSISFGRTDMEPLLDRVICVGLGYFGILVYYCLIVFVEPACIVFCCFL